MKQTNNIIDKVHINNYWLFVLFYTFTNFIYLYLYPNPIDWDGLERFNSSIILHDLIKDILFGNIHSPTEIIGYLLDYKENYRTGQGLVIWPPLQILILTLFVAIFGKSLFTVYIYSFMILFLILFFIKKVINLLDIKADSYIFILLIFFTNPIFVHHIFTLNLRFGEILAIILSVYALLSYRKTFESKYIYMIAIVSVLSVFYRLTALVGILPLSISMLIIVKNKYHLIKPLMLVFLGIIIFFGLHLIEVKLIGSSFLERVSRDFGHIELEGYYTFYQFSEYYKGLASDIITKLASHRYELNTLQKFVFGFSGIVFSGIIFIFIFIKKYEFKDKVISLALLSSSILYLILVSKHGAKPDYLLPLLFVISIFFIFIIKEIRIKLLVIFTIFVVLINLFITYTRYIHPYYEDINITLLEENKKSFDNIDTVYIANTPMKHMSYFSIVNNKKFKVVEFAKINIKNTIINLKENEIIVLNNGWNYRFGNYNYEHFAYLIEKNNTMYKVISLDSYNSNYILLKRNND